MPIEAKWAISLLVASGLIWIGWRYTPVLVTLHIAVCIILVIVIMLQSGNAADLAGAFGGAGSQTAFGPRGAATFLSKATTWCAIVFMMTSLTLSVKRTPTDVAAAGGGSILEQTSKTAPPAKPGTPTKPLFPTQTPAPNQTPAQNAPAQSSTPASTPAPAPAAPSGNSTPAPKK
jgi:preprotein translocase subunit SecG